MTSFGPVAPYYDELMAAVPYRMWVSYYLLLLSAQNIKPVDILDVACGTGTMAEMLQDEGFHVEGVDLSPGMIEVARKKALQQGRDLRFEVGDAATFDMGRTYNAVYSFFDSLNNIIDEDHFRAALINIGRHVESGGSFIFDLNTSYAFEAEMFDQEDMKKKTELKYKWKGEYDPYTAIITVHMRFWRHGKEFEEVHQQRAYAHEEVLEWLQEAGFHKIRAYHSYTLNPPRYRSDRIHYTAIKR
ncbi:MAG: class I SAM-dependent methyltransferase [Armatimonadetes bacterium]|nr:class I SAM-dependent methyltransferase [Armatimonadota bacterium]